MNLKEKIKKIIDTKKEGRKVEFKYNYSLNNKSQRAELVRDVSSLANASFDPHRPELKDGFLILGIDENNNHSIIDDYQTPVNDLADWDNLINELLERRIKISYEEFKFDGKKVGVIIIHESNNKPHIIRCNYNNENGKILLKKGECWTRNDGGKMPAMANNYIEIFKTEIDERVKIGIEVGLKIKQKSRGKNREITKENIMTMDLKTLNNIAKKLFK